MNPDLSDSKRWLRRNSLALALVWLVPWLLAPGPVRAEEAHRLQRSESCAACHRTIYEEWRGSSMARTVELSRWCLDGSHRILDSVDRGREIGRRCYSCHAPTAVFRGVTPYAPRDAAEGVGCDVCHSIAAVHVSSEPSESRLDLRPGAKRGTRADATAPHAVVVSELHGRGELCAGCHFFADPANGLPVDWTYPQWLGSPQAARGETCQDCHMPRRPGRISERPGDPVRTDVASHRFPGARDLSTLRGALRLGLEVEETTSGRVAVVEIENVGAGHNVPGGGGGIRQLELRLCATHGEGCDVLLARRAYEIRYFKADGTQTGGSDPEATRFEDSGIRPGETRTERVVLPELPGGVRRIGAELRFWYVSPEAQARSGVQLDAAIAGPVHVADRRVEILHGARTTRPGPSPVPPAS